jgi:chromosome segregation ATPase
LDWDRDFDLILESRQGNDRQNSAIKSKVETLQRDLEKLRKEEEDLKARRQVFSSNVTGEDAFVEMLRLEAGSPERARAMLDAKLIEVRSRIADIEAALRRAKRVK